jgi:hypothetical protein
MLESLARSGKNVSIQHTMNGNAIGGCTDKEARYLQANPSITSAGSEND